MKRSELRDRLHAAKARGSKGVLVTRVGDWEDVIETDDVFAGLVKLNGTKNVIDTFDLTRDLEVQMDNRRCL